jgi:hypothetical protein
MNLLARLATGHIALWCTFWLAAVPLIFIWNSSLGCMMAGCGIGEPFIAGSIKALFTLSSAAIPLASVALWRSSSNYPREAWWHGPLAIAAKIYAAFSAFAATLSLLAILYFAFTFVQAGLDHG